MGGNCESKESGLFVIVRCRGVCVGSRKERDLDRDGQALGAGTTRVRGRVRGRVEDVFEHAIDLFAGLLHSPGKIFVRLLSAHPLPERHEQRVHEEVAPVVPVPFLEAERVQVCRRADERLDRRFDRRLDRLAPQVPSDVAAQGLPHGSADVREFGWGHAGADPGRLLQHAACRPQGRPHVRPSPLPLFQGCQHAFQVARQRPPLAAGLPGSVLFAPLSEELSAVSPPLRHDEQHRLAQLPADSGVGQHVPDVDVIDVAHQLHEALLHPGVAADVPLGVRVDEGAEQRARFPRGAQELRGEAARSLPHALRHGALQLFIDVFLVETGHGQAPRCGHFCY